MGNPEVTLARCTLYPSRLGLSPFPAYFLSGLSWPNLDLFWTPTTIRVSPNSKGLKIPRYPSWIYAVPCVLWDWMLLLHLSYRVTNTCSPFYLDAMCIQGGGGCFYFVLFALFFIRRLMSKVIKKKNLTDAIKVFKVYFMLFCLYL